MPLTAVGVTGIRGRWAGAGEGSGKSSGSSFSWNSSPQFQHGPFDRRRRPHCTQIGARYPSLTTGSWAFFRRPSHMAASWAVRDSGRDSASSSGLSFSGSSKPQGSNSVMTTP